MGFDQIGNPERHCFYAYFTTRQDLTQAEYEGTNTNCTERENFVFHSRYTIYKVGVGDNVFMS